MYIIISICSRDFDDEVERTALGLVYPWLAGNKKVFVSFLFFCLLFPSCSLLSSPSGIFLLGDAAAVEYFNLAGEHS